MHPPPESLAVRGRGNQRLHHGRQRLVLAPRVRGSCDVTDCAALGIAEFGRSDTARFAVRKELQRACPFLPTFSEDTCHSVHLGCDFQRMRKEIGMGPRAFVKMDDSSAPAATPEPLMPTKSEMFRELRPFLLPKFGHLRLRIFVVFVLIVGVRGCNIYIPILFKNTVDSLSAVQPSLPIFSIVMYASLRFLVSIQRDIRSLFWLPVEQYTRRSISLYVFRHLHSLSLSFHLNRKTVSCPFAFCCFFQLISHFQGEVLRVIERGTTSIETLFNTVVFSIGPTLFDVGTVCVVFISYGEISQAAIIFVTILLYCILTWSLTEWRTKFRKQQNEADNKSDQKAIDSLLNFETVKYFTGEEMEARQ